MISSKRGFFTPCLLFLVYFILYLPLCLLMVYSFNSSPIPTPLNSFTLHWYRELFKNGEVWHSFFNSMVVATSTSFICLLFSLLLIYYKTIGGRIKRIIPLFYGNLMIPDTVLAISLVSFFSLINIPLGLTAIVIGHSVLGLGLSVPLIYLRYKDLDISLLEASAVLGASSWTTFRRIVLPFMMPALLATGLMIFILSFDDFILAYFCAGASAQTLSLYLVSSLRFGISPIINALATFVVVFTTILVSLLFILKRKEEIETC